jgi:hypothetical protein
MKSTNALLSAALVSACPSLLSLPAVSIAAVSAGGYVFTSIALPTSIFSFGTGYFCAVDLIPLKAGDFSVVGEVKSSIHVEYL